MKQVDNLEGVNEKKDEVEKEREDLAVQLGVAQATIQSLTMQVKIVYFYISASTMCTYTYYNYLMIEGYVGMTCII